MNSIQRLTNTVACIAMTLVLVGFAATPVSASSQGNQLRTGSDLQGQRQTAPILQNNPIAAESSVGQMVIGSEVPKTFESNLGLPAPLPSGEQQANEVLPVKRLDLSSIVSQIAQATVFVLIFCVALLFLLRKIKADRFFSKPASVSDLASERMHLVGTIRLAGNRRLELIEVDGKKLVVLSGPSGESSLLQIDGRSATAVPGIKQLKREATFSLDAHPESPQARFAKLGI